MDPNNPWQSNVPSFSFTDYDPQETNFYAAMQSPQPGFSSQRELSFHDQVKGVVSTFDGGMDVLPPGVETAVGKLKNRLDVSEHPTRPYRDKKTGQEVMIEVSLRTRDRQNYYYLNEMQKALAAGRCANTALYVAVSGAMERFNTNRDRRSPRGVATAEQLLNSGTSGQQPGGYLPYRPPGGHSAGSSGGQQHTR
ncbi:hypothetical protein ABT336_20500 [Micromonospora sp. NPDC000207]|uniref:hypothetical protein n=1 Tax=Micromonospora sp. NPDC000207 TaxID=3154246 RepID=UPI00331DC946